MEPSQALHRAAADGDADLATELLTLAEPAEADGHRDAGLTALCVAVQRGHLDVARVLLEHRADVNAQCGGGWTPLHHAVREGNFAIAKLLCLHKAAPGIAGRLPGKCDGVTPADLAHGDTARAMRALLAAAAACLVPRAERADKDERTLAQRVAEIERSLEPRTGTPGRGKKRKIEATRAEELEAIGRRALVELTSPVRRALGSLGHLPASRAEATRLLAAAPPAVLTRLLQEPAEGGADCGDETCVALLGRLLAGADEHAIRQIEATLAYRTSSTDWRVQASAARGQRLERAQPACMGSTLRVCVRTPLMRLACALRVQAMAEELLGRLYHPTSGSLVSPLARHFAHFAAFGGGSADAGGSAEA